MSFNSTSFRKRMMLAALLLLAACDGSGKSSIWGHDDRELCERYNSCDDPCKFYGNCGGGE